MACNIQIGTDLYATCLCSPILIFLCTVLVTFKVYQDWAKFLIILMIPEPCSKLHQYLYARWSIFSDRFPNTMQSYDQNSTLSLRYCCKAASTLHLIKTNFMMNCHSKLQWTLIRREKGMLMRSSCWVIKGCLTFSLCWLHRMEIYTHASNLL